MTRSRSGKARTVARLTLDEQEERRAKRQAQPQVQDRVATPVPAQMGHASGGKARKRAREGERAMERERGERRGPQPELIVIDEAAQLLQALAARKPRMTETQRAVLTALEAQGISTPGQIAEYLNKLPGNTVRYSRKGLFNILRTLVGRGYAKPIKRSYMTWYDITDAGRQALEETS